MDVKQITQTNQQNKPRVEIQNNFLCITESTLHVDCIFCLEIHTVCAAMEMMMKYFSDDSPKNHLCKLNEFNNLKNVQFKTKYSSVNI